MKPSRLSLIAYGRIKDFLVVPNKDRFARLLDPPQLPRPVKAFLDSQGYLTWKWYSDTKNRKEGDTRQRPALQKAPVGLCFQFARLTHGSDGEIVAFAERWGPLGLDTRAEERIEEWRGYAALAGALLRFAGARATKSRVADQDWQTICELTVPALIDDRLTTQEQTSVTALAVNTWFAKARGHRILDVVDGKLQIRPAASNLFGVLIAQIAHVMAYTDEMAICAGCRDAFTPKRPISRGARQYCKRCRKAKVPQRDASRDWRRRGNPKRNRQS